MSQVRVKSVFCVLLVTYALCLVAWVVGCHPPRHASTRRSPVMQIERVARVEVVCVTGAGFAAWRGSAVVIGPSTLLTAQHVADCDSGIMTVEGEDGSMVPFTVDAIAPTLDIALATTVLPAWPSARTVTVGPPPGIGDEVCIVSAFPFQTRQCGRVNGVGSDKIAHDAFVEPGNSGGGVYDMAGRLVGIVSTYRVCSAGGLGQVCGGAFGVVSAMPWLVRQ